MIISKYSYKYFRIFAKYTLKYFCMDKQIIKNIIIEKQIAIPNYKNLSFFLCRIPNLSSSRTR